MKIKWGPSELIFRPKIAKAWSRSHASQPTAVRLSKDVFRVFYSSRDDANKSRVAFFDWSLETNNVLRESQEPVLDIGGVGSFDESGVMPTSVIEQGENLYLFYTGWSTKQTVRYQNSIGLAVSQDRGESFDRVYAGPVFGQDLDNPYFIGTCHVFWDENREVFRAVYASCTEWVKRDQGDNKGWEPRYLLKTKSSTDLKTWFGRDEVAISYSDESVGGLVTASVVVVNKQYLMFFAERKVDDYRTNPSRSYKIRVAQSPDGYAWTPLKGDFGPEQRVPEVDDVMQSYPNVHKLENSELLMFFNGNGFGSTGILASKGRVEEGK